MKIKKKKLLFSLRSPFHVVGPGHCAGQLEHKRLQTHPEVDLLQRIVQPAARDTKVCVMRRDVVNAVVYARQNYVQILQYCDVARQAEVSVTPLVKLANHNSQSIAQIICLCSTKQLPGWSLKQILKAKTNTNANCSRVEFAHWCLFESWKPNKPAAVS